ncbi:hypothetical protein BT93_H2791 [Corymbia citriodora subsp. variegata]|nr:hypothetical protein BT93_H2791 [Corymbia citriodora subsp. variegata]
MTSSLFIFLPLSISFFFFIKIFSTETAPQYLYHDCPSAALLAPDSTYQSNLHTLLSNLSSTATHTTAGFAVATTGQNPPDRAYGAFLCRGDLDITTCGYCVGTGVQGILERCPNQRASAIWYDRCMLRYSNRAIFAAMEWSPNVIFFNMGNVSDATRFTQLLRDTLNDVTMRASADGLGKKVAAAEANLAISQKLYALAQCTPDLTSSDCVACLQIGIANLPEGKQGGRFLAPSCNLRYELYPFYNASGLPLPAPPPPAPAHPAPGPVTGSEDPNRSRDLVWSTRYKIACGIARGMRYLHEESRIQVIHRDLKASNILLDDEMNPKISDFGIARTIKADQSQENTNKVVGTIGYIAPEYILHGELSMKLDIYSFGILLLELVSGQKNKSFCQLHEGEDIAIHARKNLRDGTPLAVLDPAIKETNSEDEVLRCIRIGLLCTLEDPNQRPTMADIVRELSSRPIPLELPQQPAFVLGRTERPVEVLETDESTGTIH